MPKRSLSGHPNLIAILVAVVAFCASLNMIHAQSTSLLPSQDDPNLFSVKICQDREVLSIIASSASAILKTKVIIANGKADDIHLDGVYANEHGLLFYDHSANKVVDNVRYIIGPMIPVSYRIRAAIKVQDYFPKKYIDLNR